MKYFIVSFDYPPSNGGIARLCFEIKKNLLNFGNQVVVLAPTCDGYDLQNDENVVRFGGGRLSLYKKIYSYLKSNVTDEDIVITGTWHPAGLICELACANVYFLAHGLEFLSAGNWKRQLFLNTVGKCVLRKANGVVANSHYTAHLVKKISPMSNVFALPLAVDCDAFRPTKPKVMDDVVRVFSISRLEKFKGHDFLIDVVSDINKRYPGKIQLVIGGKGPYKESLEHRTKQKGADNYISFAGYISDEALCDYYSEADLFVLCTRQSQNSTNVEGFGLVFCEAQACGTAVIGTRTGGIPDAIEEDNGGWLIEQDNQVELSNLLEKAISDKISIHNMGKLARRRMEQYRWEEYTKKLIEYVRI